MVFKLNSHLSHINVDLGHSKQITVEIIFIVEAGLLNGSCNFCHDSEEKLKYNDQTIKKYCSIEPVFFSVLNSLQNTTSFLEFMGL